MARVLGSCRLSHDTDASTSIERQREDITNRIHADRNVLVHVAEDTDVSGAKSPFSRAGLGPWLTDPGKIAKWDTLMVSKLDRLTRSVLDFGDLLEWCKTHKKNVVSLDGEVNTNTATGWLHVQVVMTFSEYERRQMSERRADASRKIYTSGDFNGGASLPWGYMAIARASGGFELAPDPAVVTLAAEIAGAVLGGESVASIATRHGMHDTTLLSRLRSPSLKGVVMYHGEVVRGADGLPKLRTPIIDGVTWSRLQARLDANSKGAGIPKDATPWLDVIYCAACGGKMYYQRYRKRPVTAYYHKKSDCTVRLRGADVHGQIDGVVRRAWQGKHATETIEIAGEDHTEELHQMEEAISDWEAKALLPGASADSILRVLDGLNARKQAIVDAGVVTEASTEEVTTEVPLIGLWDSADGDHAKGALLRRLGYKIFVKPDGRGQADVRLERTWRGRTWRELIPDMADDA